MRRGKEVKLQMSKLKRKTEGEEERWSAPTNQTSLGRRRLRAKESDELVERERGNDPPRKAKQPVEEEVGDHEGEGMTDGRESEDGPIWRKEGAKGIPQLKSRTAKDRQ